MEKDWGWAVFRNDHFIGFLRRDWHDDSISLVGQKEMTTFTDRHDPERERLLIEAIKDERFDDCWISECCEK